MPQMLSRSRTRTLIAGTLSLLLASGCLPAPSQTSSTTPDSDVVLSGKSPAQILQRQQEEVKEALTGTGGAPPVKPPVVSAADAIGGIRGTVWVPPGIISSNGGSVVSSNGGSIISHNGGSIISHNGGSIISHNGGSIISHNGGSLRGQQVPLAHAVVRLVDAAGTPVMHEGEEVVAETDAEGRYAFPVKVEGRNLVVKAEVPGQTGELVSLLPKEGLKDGEQVEVDITSTLMLEYVLSQYVKGDVAIFEKLPKEVAERARGLVEEAIAAKEIALPETLEKAALAEKVAEVRKADQGVDQVFEEIKDLLIVVGIQNQGDGVLATEYDLGTPAGVTGDGEGNLYLFSQKRHAVWKITPDGVLHTLVQSGEWGYTEQRQQSYFPGHMSGIAFDSSGNLVVADTYHNRIVRITHDRKVEVIAGTGAIGYGGDGGQATAAILNRPTGLAIDEIGQLYFSDTENHRIRRISLDGRIKTVSGDGSAGSGGDGGRADAAQLNRPQGLTFGFDRRLFVADYGNNRVRVIKDGSISTAIPPSSTIGGPIALTFEQDRGVVALYQRSGDLLMFNGTGTQAINRRLIEAANAEFVETNFPRVLWAEDGLTITDDGQGHLYSFDKGLTHLAGLRGDDSARELQFLSATSLAIDSQENIYVVEVGAKKIFKVTPDGTMTHFAGNGGKGIVDSSDTPKDVPIGMPLFVAVNNNDEVIFGGFGPPGITKIDTNGHLAQIAGNGEYDYVNEPIGPALEVALAQPQDVIQEATGDYLIAEPTQNRILRLSETGQMSIAAKGSATNYPKYFSRNVTGELVFIELTEERVSSLREGKVVPLVEVSDLNPYIQFSQIEAMALDAEGRLYLAGVDRVVRWHSGNVQVIAGPGAPFLSGTTADDGLREVKDIAIAPDGDLYILESSQLKRLSREQLQGI